MALSKLQFNSINVTPSASEGIRFNSGANGFETASAGGNVALIKTQTISSGTGTVSFVDGTSSVVLDNTYKEYIFYFNNIHPATDNAKLTFQASTDTGSNYGVTITSTRFYAFHRENDATPELAYDTSEDLAQSTGFQNVTGGIGNGNDEVGNGYIHLFNPSSTTFVKHFIVNANSLHGLDASLNAFTAGYYNSTSAIDAIQFKMSSGNIDAGTISLYGVT